MGLKRLENGNTIDTDEVSGKMPKRGDIEDVLNRLCQDCTAPTIDEYGADGYICDLCMVRRLCDCNENPSLDLLNRD